MDPAVIGILSGLLAGSITHTKVLHGGSVAATAVSGKPSTMGFQTLLNEDCSSAGAMATEIVQGPEHGYLTLRDEKSHPNYKKGNNRVKCNKLIVDGSLIEYTSKPGYHGPDIFSVKTRTSLGYAVTHVYYVTVK
jgi:hypothetical protein